MQQENTARTSQLVVSLRIIVFVLSIVHENILVELEGNFFAYFSDYLAKESQLYFWFFQIVRSELVYELFVTQSKQIFGSLRVRLELLQLKFTLALFLLDEVARPEFLVVDRQLALLAIFLFLLPLLLVLLHDGLYFG